MSPMWGSEPRSDVRADADFEAAEKLAMKFWQLRTFPSESLPDWDHLTDEERAQKIEHAHKYIFNELARW